MDTVIYLRFMPEMNRFWVHWSTTVQLNTTAEYSGAWRRTHDVFTACGATNVTWVCLTYVPTCIVVLPPS